MTSFDIRSLRKDIRIDTHLLGIPMTFYSTWGLFSPREIDEGSELLINATGVRPDDQLLDIGCGYGPIGLTLANLVPKGIVHMIDKDFVAIEYTKKNALINRINNCQIYLSNGLDQVPNIEFNCIVSNLPAKVGKEFFWILFHDAKKYLKRDGKFYVVTISGLREFIKRNCMETFGNYEKVAHSKTYTVSLARKQ